MTIPIEKRISTEFHAEPDLSTILKWIPYWNPLTKQQARSPWDAITVDQAINAAKLSETFQEMILSKKYIDPLNLSTTSSVIVPQEALEHLVWLEEELDGVDVLTNDPGLLLVRNWKRPFSTVRRKTKYSWILIEDVNEIDEAFICTSRFSFFKKWRWLFPNEFEAAKDEMKALAAKHNWPIIWD